MASADIKVFGCTCLFAMLLLIGLVFFTPQVLLFRIFIYVHRYAQVLMHADNQRLVYVTGFAKRGLIRAITNIEKYRFEILNAVYLENA